MGAVEFRSLPGLTPYKEAQSLQYELIKRRLHGEIPDTILFLEHPPVITRGRGLQWTGTRRERQMPLPAQIPFEIEYCESERGGDLTYHGPGQLVIYPICLLDGSGWAPRRDVAAFIRKLESTCSTWLAELGLKTVAIDNATGVWVQTDGAPKKIASIGIAVRRWVTFHGIAINIANDLSPFRIFSPCGFQPEVMTNLRELLPTVKETESDWRSLIEQKWIQHITAATPRLSSLSTPLDCRLPSQA